MSRKVLLVDDDPDDRELFCEAIGEIDPEISCETVSDGRKILAKLNETKCPDIIFLDVNLPGISGWDCLIKLKEHESYREIPVIMYSTSSTSSDVEKATRLAALCFLSKPPDFRELKKSLEIVIQYLKNNSLSSIVFASPLFAVSTK